MPGVHEKGSTWRSNAGAVVLHFARARDPEQEEGEARGFSAQHIFSIKWSSEFDRVGPSANPTDRRGRRARGSTR